MVDFSDHATRLSAEADTRLGDLILYAKDGESGGDYVAMKGRVLADEGRPSFTAGMRSAMDEARGGWMLRIAKDLVPAPSMKDRLKCEAILGEGVVYRPIGKDPIGDGRYWLVAIQKA